MKNQKVTVIGAQGDERSITLYLLEGDPITLPAKGHRIISIMDKITKPLSMRKAVEIDLSDYSAHRMVEAKSGGLIKFFKRKISEVGSAIGIKSGTSEVTFLGRVGLGQNETIVAEVNGVEIPGMENIDLQIENAAYGEGFKGFAIFMERMSKVMEDRGHTVQDLLRFMERGDLPIADDGCVIGYKTLNTSKTEGTEIDNKFTFVDKHSGRVYQRVGSRVSMPESKVDKSRSTECSSGLHIARRSYLSGYMGQVICLAKIGPEDIIAVPRGDPSKMRVCAYHIVAKLPSSAMETLGSDKAMTSDPECAKILANVIKGDHTKVMEEVRVGIDTGKVKVVPRKKATTFLGAGDNGMAAALTDKESEKKPLDIAKISQQVEAMVKDKMAMTDDQKEAERLISVQGLNLTVVAEIVGVSRRTLGRWIEKFDMTIPDKDAPPINVETGVQDKPKAPAKPTSKMTPDQATAKQLLADGMSRSEVATESGISRRTLGRWIEKFDMKYI